MAGGVWCVSQPLHPNTPKSAETFGRDGRASVDQAYVIDHVAGDVVDRDRPDRMVLPAGDLLRVDHVVADHRPMSNGFVKTEVVSKERLVSRAQAVAPCHQNGPRASSTTTSSL